MSLLDEMEKVEPKECIILSYDAWRILMNEVAQLEAALEFIGDIAYDRDGYTGDAEKLGELVDEIYRYARNPEDAHKALGGEDG